MLNGRVLLNGVSTDVRPELWVTDGTAAGTRQLHVNGSPLLRTMMTRQLGRLAAGFIWVPKWNTAPVVELNPIAICRDANSEFDLVNS